MLQFEIHDEKPVLNERCPQTPPSLKREKSGKELSPKGEKIQEGVRSELPTGSPKKLIPLVK